MIVLIQLHTKNIILPPPWYDIVKLLTIKIGDDFDFDNIYARSPKTTRLIPLGMKWEA